MIGSKIILAGAALTAAAGISWWQGARIEQARQANAALRQEIQQVREATEHRQKAIEAAQAETVDHPGLVGVSATPADPPPMTAATNAPTAPVQSRDGQPYVPLSKANLKRFQVRGFTETFAVTDAAAALLGMTSAERQAVDQTAAELIRRHHAMDLARVQEVTNHLTAEAGRKTSFRVPAYPQEGQALAQETVATAVGILGSNRTDVLLHYARLNEVSADGFEPFGRTEKTITFLDRFNEDGSRGNCEIFLRVADTASGLTLSSSFANAEDNIPPNWRHLIQNVDPDNAAGKP